MLFNSFAFLIFAPLFLLAYFLVPRKLQMPVTLGASLFFYMYWEPEYIVLILFCAAVNYFGAIQIAKQETRARKLTILWICTLLNLSVIFLFKYVNFFGDTFAFLASSAGSSFSFTHLDLILPVGISFYTFHTLAYTIDVYRDETPVERDPIILLLYVVFWPMLLAGPIERSNHLIPQFKVHHKFSLDDTLIGLNRIVLGIFKKIVVADRLAAYVNTVYADVPNQSALNLAVAMFFFTIQIYCDFSGYCDVALGVARIMGFDLFENFNRPYTARSISQFWDRWHMSLSRWFRDYVYIPLGGSRVSKPVHYRNVMITFLVSGLWHGANWTFVFWGGLHGVLLVIENMFKKVKINPFSSGPGHWLALTLNHLIMLIVITITWVFFRAGSLSDAFLILTRGLDISSWHYDVSLFIGKGPITFMLSVLVVGLLAMTYLLPKDMKLKHSLAFQLVGTVIIILLGKSGSSEFIYFQF